MRPLLALLALLAVAVRPARAQADYINTDHARPFTVQDALPIERHSIELALLPFTATARRGTAMGWSTTPGIAWGLLPLTQLQLGADLERASSGSSWSAKAYDVELLHALNVETGALPALALEAAVSLPASAGIGTSWSATALATRTFSTASRVHLNASVLGAAGHQGGWAGGVAVDHPLPMKFLLLGAEIAARRPASVTPETSVDVTAGMRWQRGVRWVIDAGVSRAVYGPEQGWRLTVGNSYTTAIAALIPGRYR